MDDQDAKNRILKAAAEILDETEDIERITIRQIAERAGVGTGLINYHFKSKDNLLNVVVGDKMAQIVMSFTGQKEGEKPVTRLKTMLKELFSYAEGYEKLMRFSLARTVLGCEMDAELFLVPMLKEIFGSEKAEMELRIIAMQILLPLQAASINAQSFRLYSGVDLYSEAQRNSLIDALIDNVIRI
jgi:AcrR family transcriptional regulator